MFASLSGATVIDKTNAADGPIERQDQVIEIPRTTYRHNGFEDGELSARIEDQAVLVFVSTIDGESTVRVPVKHLAAVSDLLAFIRDDQ